jgi:hypothetical protein
MRRIIFAHMLALVLAAMAAGAASAQTPITVSKHFHKETFTATGTLNCQGEKLNDLTVTFNEQVRITAAGEATGDEGLSNELLGGSFLPPLHFHHTFVAKLVAVPVNGRGPTYIGHHIDVETLNAKSLEEFIGTYSDQHRLIARGSDGSKINYHLHVRFGVNAKGEVTVDFFRVRPDASCLSDDE